MIKRNFIQARNLLEEAKKKINDFDAIIGRTLKDYEELRKTGIKCKAFFIDNGNEQTIEITRQCWNHVFKNPVKRQSKIEKIERALAFPLAKKLLEKTTTYQEVSKEKDKGGNNYTSFGIIGYVRGNRVKVVVRKNENNRLILFSFYQMSSAPIKKETEDKKL